MDTTTALIPPARTRRQEIGYTRHHALELVRELAEQGVGAIPEVLTAGMRDGIWRCQWLSMRKSNDGTWTLKVQWHNMEPPPFDLLFEHLKVPVGAHRSQILEQDARNGNTTGRVIGALFTWFEIDGVVSVPEDPMPPSVIVKPLPEMPVLVLTEIDERTEVVEPPILTATKSDGQHPQPTLF